MRYRTINRLTMFVVILTLAPWVLMPAGCTDMPGDPAGPSPNANEGEPTGPVPLDDADGDGVGDESDSCPDTPDGGAVDGEGCPVEPPDADGDGVVDDDLCPDGAPSAQLDDAGCPGQADPDPGDRDDDRVVDLVDQCPDTPAGMEVDDNGCADSQLDSDNDNVMNDVDRCTGTPTDSEVDNDGCAASQRDSDGDKVTDDLDDCPNTPAGDDVDEVGCPASQPDGDDDVTDDLDGCPDDPDKTEEGTCGCGVADDDSDADGTADCNDGCPDDPGKTAEGDCGCGVADTDTDSDGVSDCRDNCPSVSNPGQEDADGDGAGDACEDDTDGDDGGGGPACGDGVVDDDEACDDAGESATCNADCTPASCGDGIVNGSASEECDPPDGITCNDECLGTGSCCAARFTPGCEDASCAEAVCAVDPFCCGQDDGVGFWDQDCVLEAIDLCGVEVENDDCASPITVTDGNTLFDNLCAITDGPEEAGLCEDLDSDVWFCYTASCTGSVTISLAGSSYDAVMAVYEGCGCPATAALACSDDDCGFGLESRLVLVVEEGQSFMIRIGGYRPSPENKWGEGTMSITCGGEDPCGPGAGDCFVDNGTPGCEDVDCCNDICAQDCYCCDVEWDDLCVGSALGFCGPGFEACQTSDEPCDVPHDTPGCADVDCCQGVCESDVWCCTVDWDQRCADAAGDCL